MSLVDSTDQSTADTVQAGRPDDDRTDPSAAIRRAIIRKHNHAGVLRMAATRRRNKVSKLLKVSPWVCAH